MNTIIESSPLYRGNLPKYFDLRKHQLQLMQKMYENEQNSLIIKNEIFTRKEYMNFITAKSGCGKTKSILAYIYSQPIVPNNRVLTSVSSSNYSNIEYNVLKNYPNVSLIVSNKKILSSVWRKEAQNLGLNVIDEFMKDTSIKHKNIINEDFKMAKLLIDQIDNEISKLNSLKKSSSLLLSRKRKLDEEFNNLSPTSSKFDKNNDHIILLVSENIFFHFINSFIKFGRIIIDDILDCNNCYQINCLKLKESNVWPASFTWVVNSNTNVIKNVILEKPKYNSKNLFYSHIYNFINTFYNYFIDIDSEYINQCLNLPETNHYTLVSKKSVIFNFINNLPINSKLKEFLKLKIDPRDYDTIINSDLLKSNYYEKIYEESEKNINNTEDNINNSNTKFQQFTNHFHLLINIFHKIMLNLLFQKSYLISFDFVPDKVYNDNELDSLLIFFKDLYDNSKKIIKNYPDINGLIEFFDNLNEIFNNYTEIVNSRNRFINYLKGNDTKNQNTDSQTCTLCYASDIQLLCSSCQNLGVCKSCYNALINQQFKISTGACHISSCLSICNLNVEIKCPLCCQLTPFFEIEENKELQTKFDPNKVFLFQDLNQIFSFSSENNKKILVYINPLLNFNIQPYLSNHNYIVKKVNSLRSNLINESLESFQNSNDNYCWVIHSDEEILGLNLQFIDAIIFIDIFNEEKYNRLIYRAQRLGRKKSLNIYSIRYNNFI